MSMIDELDKECNEMIRVIERTQQAKEHAAKSVARHQRARNDAVLVRQRAQEYADSESLNAMMARRLSGTPLTRRQRWKWLVESFLGRRYFS